MKTFKPQGAELVEEASVPMPESIRNNSQEWQAYISHIEHLTRYTINPDDWKGITQVKEGEFEVIERPVEVVDVNGYYVSTRIVVFAIPKREEDLFKTAMDNDWSAKKAIAYILENYTLTKK